MTRVLFALCLVLAAASSQACNGSKPAPTSPSDRPLSAFQPYLTRTLTPEIAKARFGAPDAIVGSGLLIYQYRIAGERTLWLAFPGFAPIIYARIQTKDGAVTDLPL
jgi:hypothetical protein